MIVGPLRRNQIKLIMGRTVILGGERHQFTGRLTTRKFIYTFCAEASSVWSQFRKISFAYISNRGARSKRVDCLLGTNPNKALEHTTKRAHKSKCSVAVQEKEPTEPAYHSRHRPASL
jgi:hypothetical protein